MYKFSVNICVYYKDNAEWFRDAIESVTTFQTCKPSEVVIVVDGPVCGKLDEYISQLENKTELFKVVRLKKNVGHAGARQVALEASTNERIAIMDADDISEPRRFEKMLAFMNAHPDVAVVGGQIEEFIDIPNNIVGKREVPLTHGAIFTRLKSRCPFNQMSVSFLRSAIMNVGGYRDWYCDEDYYLWVRLLLGNYKFANLPDTLVKVRVGKEMYQRRGGWKYFRSETKLQRFMLKNKIISFPRYCWNVLGRFVIQVTMPHRLRGFIFQKFFRK